MDNFHFMHDAFFSYKSDSDALHHPKKLKNHSVLRPEVDFISIFGNNFKNAILSHDMVHIIDEQNIVTYVVSHCGTTWYTEAPIKKNIAIRKGKIIPELVKTQVYPKYCSTYLFDWWGAYL